MDINDILYGLFAFYACLAVLVGLGAVVITLFDIKIPEIGQRLLTCMWILFASTIAAGGLLWVADTLFG